MGVRSADGALFISGEIGLRALDALDRGVVVLLADLRTVLHCNRAATRLVGPLLSAPLYDAIDDYVQLRAALHRLPPAERVETNGAAVYISVVHEPGDPPIEIVLIREEVVRDADAFRELNTRYNISRREYQIVLALRLGKTNRKIAEDLGLAEGTVARHIHRMLGRLGAPNRTRLVDLIEQTIHFRE
jgi:DNA-binding CsgD family transcriptional regulator